MLSCVRQGLRLGLLVACGVPLNFASYVKWSFGGNTSRSLSLRAGHASPPTLTDILRHAGRSRRRISFQQSENTINRSASVVACHMRLACMKLIHLARLSLDENACNRHLIYSHSHVLSGRGLINPISARLRVPKAFAGSAVNESHSVFLREPTMLHARAPRQANITYTMPSLGCAPTSRLGALMAFPDTRKLRAFLTGYWSSHNRHQALFQSSAKQLLSVQ
jgi:hypothetical protein